VLRRNRIAVALVAIAALCAVGIPATHALPRAAEPDESTTVPSSTVDSSSTVPETTTTTVAPVRLPRVLLVGDSTMAALRWFTNAAQSLQGAEFVLDVESCRSVGGRSCWGREQRIPPNAYTVIKYAPRTFDVVVLMAGTHSYYRTIAEEFRKVKKLAARKGFTLVVLTLRDPHPSKKRVSTMDMRTIASINAMIKTTFGRPKSDETYVADWNSFSAGRGNWFRRDGIHLNLRGVLALGWYLSNVVARVSGEPCPGVGSGTCTMPTRKDALRDWVRNYGVPYTEEHCYQDGYKRKKVCQRDRRMP
jgi:hypothetical protein